MAAPTLLQRCHQAGLPLTLEVSVDSLSQRE